MQRRFALDRRCLVCADYAVTVLGAGFEQDLSSDGERPPASHTYTGKGGTKRD
jgi:hypothetical protein